MVSSGQIMDLARISHGFPELPDIQVIRTQYLNTIEQLFEDKKLVIIEGNEGTGKTTLLAQFVLEHPQSAISLFIKPANSFTYKSDLVLLDLCNQIEWILTGKEIDSIDAPDVNERLLQKHLFALATKARRNRQCYYFVIDGLHHIPERERHVYNQIVSMFPFGIQNFRFLVSGDPEQLRLDNLVTGSVKSVLLMGFTLVETKQYFSDSSLDEGLVEVLFRICQKAPISHLASVKRIIQTCEQPSDLIENLPRELPELFELEWRQVQRDNKQQTLLLAILAYDSRPHPVEELAQIAGSDNETIVANLSHLSFIDFTSSGEVNYVSEAFRKFAVSRLPYSEVEVLDILIEYWSGHKDSEGALVNLPGYYTQKKDFDSLFSFMSENYFDQLLHRKQSISFLQRMTVHGMSAALETDDYQEIVRYTLQKAIIDEVNMAGTWRSEVQAHMALDDFDAALTLTQSAVLKEDRLHLLAVIAKQKKDKGLVPEEELNDQIRQLYGQIDKSAIGNERAVDIALDLIYSHPDLAIELVEEGVGVSGRTDALDLAFVRLSIEALRRDVKGDMPDSVHNIRSKIQSPVARQISQEVSLLLGDYSSDEIIAEATRIEEIDRRLFLLRRWLLDNREREDAAIVLEYALDLAIRTTEYSASARIFRELATPLPHIVDQEKVQRLLRSFDGQIGFVEELGPTEEYVRLQILLTHAESNWNFEAASNRFIETYLYVCDIPDLAIKTECIARLLASIGEIDPNETLEASYELHSGLNAEFEQCFSNLLKTTAEHYGETRAIIRGLAKRRPKLALDCALRLNTESRRNHAIHDLIESGSNVPPMKLNFPELEQALSHLVYPHILDSAVLSVLLAISKSKDVDQRVLAQAKPILARVPDFHDAGLRCQACCYVFSIVTKAGNSPDIILDFDPLDLLERSWEAIDLGWHRIEVGFNIVETLASSSYDIAQKYLQLTLELKNQLALYSEASVSAYIGCLRLAVRAFGSLIHHRQEQPSEMEHLVELIKRLPSHGEQAILFAEIALRFVVAERSDEARVIVSEYVRPSIEQIALEDAGYRNFVIRQVAPALEFAHKVLALELVSKLAQPERDSALVSICEFKFKKSPEIDYFEDDPNLRYDISYEDVVDICEILKLIEEDSRIALYILYIVNSIKNDRNRVFSRRQIADICNRLQDIAESKFPNSKHIKHEGYKIVAKAHILSLTPRTKKQTWLELDSATEAIPNVADRAFIWTELAGALPNKYRDMRPEILEKALAAIESIPSTLDKAARFEFFAREVFSIDETSAKKALTKAMEIVIEKENPHAEHIRRRLIDFAYRIDDDLASSLAALADDDPAKSRAKMDMARRIEILKLKKDLDTKGNKSTDVIELAEAAAMRLAAMNAGRAYPVHQGEINKLLENAAEAPLSISFPIFSLVIQNAVSRFSSQTQTSNALRYVYPAFRAALISAQLTQLLAARSLDELQKTKEHVLHTETSSITLIRAGERKKAIDLIRSWISAEVDDFLYICDPYFGVDDLEILEYVLRECIECKVSILTSILHQENQGIPKPWSTAYTNHWRQKISDMDPPPTTIIVVGFASDGRLPVHDRWWVTKRNGLLFGTSFNGLGISRDSNVSIMTPEDVQIYRAEFEEYSSMHKRIHQGERLSYEVFTIN